MLSVFSFDTKIKKKCIVFLVCISILFNLGFFDLSANADTYKYEEPQPFFADVDESASYYNDLKFLIDLNIIIKIPNGLFSPQKSVSRGEFVKMLMVALKYEGINRPINSFVDISGHWSAKYIDAAVTHGIINRASYGSKIYPDAPITRHEAVVFAVNALNIYPYSTPSLYSDVNNSYINLASGEYLFSGYIENGVRVFKPREVLTRAEICRVMARVIQYKEDRESFKNTKILEYIENNPITTERQMYDLLRACITSFTKTIEVEVSLSSAEVENAFNIYIALNPEKPTIASLNYLSDRVAQHRSLFKFNYEFSRSHEEKRMNEIEKVAEKFEQDYIKPGMNDTEKITQIHDYLVLTCKYDERYKDIDSINDEIMNSTTPDLFTAYGALVEKTAVCQGYAAAFNILAKRLGIQSVAITGTPPKSSINHMWNMVCINDTIYFVDATWDSTVPSADKNTINTTYLLRTEKEFASFGYKWDTLVSQKEYLNK